MHHGGAGRVPVRAVKTVPISLIAIGLLAGSAFTVAAQDDPMALAAVTGSVPPGQELNSGSSMWEEGAIRGEGAVWSHEFEASDPRLGGTRTATYGYDAYEPLEMMVATGTVVLENGDGRWVGPVSHFSGAALGVTTTMVLHGEDAYDGLTAYLVVDEAGRTFSAALFPGEMPGSSEPPVE
jgi:hypothetical protein